MNLVRKLKKVTRTMSSSSSSRIPDYEFKLQLIQMDTYYDDIDSLHCVTAISNHLVNPKKGNPVKLTITEKTLQISWNDLKSTPRKSNHALEDITYQYNSSFKSKLYGFTAKSWGGRKICIIFRLPRFSRLNGEQITMCVDSMLHKQEPTFVQPNTSTKQIRPGTT